jgi:hypothetical protein
MKRHRRSTLYAALGAFWIAGAALSGSAQQPPPPASAASEPEPPPAAPGTALPLSASLSGQAATDYQAGRLLYDDRDYAGASVKFQRAYDQSRDPRLLWNVAACEKNQRRYASVLYWLERYVREAGASMTAEHRAEVDEVMRTVRLLISTVRITIDQPEVSIFVDDVPIGTSPLMEAIRVDLGRREFRLEKPGFKDQRFAQDFAGGSEVSLHRVMEPEDKTGRLTVFASAGDTIRIDGQVVGQNQWTGVLPGGDHELRVTAEGKREYDRNVSVTAGQARSIYVTLEEAEASIPAWVWVGAGAVVAGGLATGGYFLFRSPHRASGEVGTLGTGEVEL